MSHPRRERPRFTKPEAWRPWNKDEGHYPFSNEGNPPIAPKMGKGGWVTWEVDIV